MTAKEFKEVLSQIDFNSLPDEELKEFYVEVRSKTVELNRIINHRKQLKIRHPSPNNESK